MALKIDIVMPVYNDRVKITGWTDRHESYPFDNINKNVAHYKSMGSTNDVYIPKTTTQEAMENGLKKLGGFRTLRRSVVNFTSYIEVNKMLDQDERMKEQFPTKKEPKIPMSTYQRDFTRNSNTCRNPCENIDLPHPLFNRRPKNEFERMKRDAPDKFMDAHFFEIPQNRKCINYLRQIRDVSRIFEQ